MVSVPVVLPGEGSRGSGTPASPPPHLWAMKLALFQEKKKKKFRKTSCAISKDTVSLL